MWFVWRLKIVLCQSVYFVGTFLPLWTKSDLWLVHTLLDISQTFTKHRHTDYICINWCLTCNVLNQSITVIGKITQWVFVYVYICMYRHLHIYAYIYAQSIPISLIDTNSLACWSMFWLPRPHLTCLHACTPLSAFKMWSLGSPAIDGAKQ